MKNIKVLTTLGLEDREFYRLYLKNKNNKGIGISVDISEFTNISTTEWQQEYQCKFININEKDIKMTTFEHAKVWDKVWCLFHNQWSTITDIVEDDKYPIKTELNSYTIDGRMNIKRGRTLFWDEVIIAPPEKPLPKLEVDTKVLVWDEGFYKTKAYFSHFDSNNKICVFSMGRTSWSNDSNTQSWTYWELAEDNK